MIRFPFMIAAFALLVAGSGCSSHRLSDGDAVDAGAMPIDSSVVISTDMARSDAGASICAPQDARGEGACRAIFGYVWQGRGCSLIGGCRCVGADCASLAGSAEECIAAHATCERYCGGLAEVDGCLPTELCDYPEGSFCGGDDSQGVCRARPLDCPDPGGVTMCGCDRNEYSGECAANFAGVDVARVGPCVTSSAYRTAKAERSCGPTDGPAWSITLTTARNTCDEVRTDGAITFTVWTDLESAAPGTIYSLGGGIGDDGFASVCGAPGAPCATATGTVVFHVFAAGEVARFDYDLRTDDGRRFAETDVEIARFWCGVDSPGCG